MISIYIPFLLSDAHPSMIYCGWWGSGFYEHSIADHPEIIEKPANSYYVATQTSGTSELFSWSHLKTLFYQVMSKTWYKILHTNYRNSKIVSELANRLLKIKNAVRIDWQRKQLPREDGNRNTGEVVFHEEKARPSLILSGKQAGLSFRRSRSPQWG